jgi:putative phosphoesterase
MLKVALIGDVHANLPALEAVLAHARQNHVEAIWNLGDFVGYGAYPEATVNHLRATNAISIAGNYDLKVLKVPHKAAKWKKRMNPDKWLAFKWTYEHLSPTSREYLGALPEQYRLEAAGLHVLLTHGSPVSLTEHLTPDTPEDHLAALAKMAQADVICCAHSHIPFIRQMGSTWFVNPGSVGRPDDGDPRASYAVLFFEANHFEVELQRITYDTQMAADASRKALLPRAFAQMILLGRNLDWVADHLERNHAADQTS